MDSPDGQTDQTRDQSLPRLQKDRNWKRSGRSKKAISGYVAPHVSPRGRMQYKPCTSPLRRKRTTGTMRAMMP